MGQDVRQEDRPDDRPDLGELTEEQLREALEAVPVDVPLRLAGRYAVDADAFWAESMPLILEAYPQITVSDYWNLTVSEHQELLDFLLTK